MTMSYTSAPFDGPAPPPLPHHRGASHSFAAPPSAPPTPRADWQPALDRPAAATQEFLEEGVPHVDMAVAGEPAANRYGAPRGARTGRRRSAQRSPRLPLAAMVWGGLGLAAVCYLGVALTNPQLLGRFEIPMLAMGTAATARDPALNVDVRGLASAVTDLKNEVAELRAAVDRSQAHARAIAQRVANLDGLPAPAIDFASGQTSLDRVDQAAPPPPPPALRLESAPVTAPLAAGPTKQDTKVAAAEPHASPAKVAAARVINAPPDNPPLPIAKPANPIETGSVDRTAQEAKERLAYAEPVAPGPTKAWGVQLGSAQSLDGLLLSWSLLSESQGQSLKGLRPHYTTSVNDAGLIYNLTAGPVKSESEAKKTCQALAAKAIPCQVVSNFAGAPL